MVYLKEVLGFLSKLYNKDIVKGTIAQANIRAYSLESSYAIRVCIGINLILWIEYIVLIYIGSMPVEMLSLMLFIGTTCLLVFQTIALDCRILMLMRADIAGGDIVERDVEIVKIKTEWVGSDRFGHSRVGKYFEKRLCAGRYIIKCADFQGKVLRIRSAMSANKATQIKKMVSENMKVRIRYLKKSKVLLSFVNIYHDGRYDRKREFNLLFNMNNRI